MCLFIFKMAENFQNVTFSQSNSPVSRLPVVFFCINCSRIVCDSTHWINCDEDDCTIVSNRVTKNVNVMTEMKTIVEGDKEGSLYNLLECSHCKRVLGKLFKSTPSHLDHIRDVFTLDVTSLDQYQVGGMMDTEVSIINFNKQSLNLKQIGDKMEKMQTELSSLATKVREINQVLNCDNTSHESIDENGVIESETEEDENSDMSSDDDGVSASSTLQSRIKNNTYCTSSDIVKPRSPMKDIKPKNLVLHHKKRNSSSSPVEDNSKKKRKIKD